MSHLNGSFLLELKTELNKPNSAANMAPPRYTCHPRLVSHMAASLGEKRLTSPSVLPEPKEVFSATIFLKSNIIQIEPRSPRANGIPAIARRMNSLSPDLISGRSRHGIYTIKNISR